MKAQINTTFTADSCVNYPSVVHNISQIIERNLQRQPQCADGLWINPEKDAVWRTISRSGPALKLFCQDYTTFGFHQQALADVQFAAFPGAQKRAYQWIIVNLPRQKALLRMLLDCAASLLTDDGVLWLAGENKAGIKSADKILKTHFARVTRLDNARHCTLFEARSPLHQQPFDPLAYQQKWLLDCGGSEIRVASYPGVFAHGRLDAGTALLLNNLAKMDFNGDILDFGCGAGVIGACVATHNKNASVTFLDSNALALRACEETLAANRLAGKTVASDGLKELDTSYDVIISNPPIHAGIKTDNQMSLRLLESVRERIKPGGSLMLVANRHLPYEKWLLQNFQQFEELATNSHFKVIVAEK